MSESSEWKTLERRIQKLLGMRRAVHARLSKTLLVEEWKLVALAEFQSELIGSLRAQQGVIHARAKADLAQDLIAAVTDPKVWTIADEAEE